MSAGNMDLRALPVSEAANRHCRAPAPPSSCQWTVIEHSERKMCAFRALVKGVVQLMILVRVPGKSGARLSAVGTC